MWSNRLGCLHLSISLIQSAQFGPSIISVCELVASMGSGYSCPVCPETGSENAHSTTVSLLAFSWTSWHAQSISVGMLLGMVLVISLICFCGNKFIECILPRSCLDVDRKHRRYGSRHYDSRYNKECNIMQSKYLSYYLHPYASQTPSSTGSCSVPASHCTKCPKLWI